MSDRKSSGNARSLGLVPLAVAGTALLGLPPTMAPAPLTEVRKVTAAVALLDSELLIMGGSGEPAVPQSQIDAIVERFVDPSSQFDIGQPSVTVDGQTMLWTPEGLWPLTGVKTLPLDPSVAQGVAILDGAIQQQLADGDNVVVSGYSQSSTIASLEMSQLLNSTDPPDASQLSFVLLGDPNNPDGGILSRFGDPSLPQLTIPAMGEAGQGITFSGATPADTPWTTAIYTGEYDGFADFPKYPLNILADINAIMGTQSVHLEYPSLTPEQMATAIELPTSADYTGNTEYFMIPTAGLPILDGVRSIPILGTPLADLLQPDLTVLVNLGYGTDPDIGWSTTPANLSTPFGVLPDFTTAQLETVLQALVSGTQQGITDAVGDLGSLDVSSLADPATAMSAALSSAMTTLATDPMSLINGVVQAFSAVTESLSSIVFATADVTNAILTTVPSYAAEIFAQELTPGNLFNAVGMPMAAMVGLDTFLAMINLENIEFTFTGDIPSELATFLPFL